MTNLLSSWGNLIYMFLMISSYLRLSGSEPQTVVASCKAGPGSQHEHTDFLSSKGGTAAPCDLSFLLQEDLPRHRLMHSVCAGQTRHSQSV